MKICCPNRLNDKTTLIQLQIKFELEILAESARLQAVFMKTRGDGDDPNALCSAVTSGTCFCKTGYTGTEQDRMLFVQALLAGARFLLKLPAMTATSMTTVAIDHVVILHLSHPFLLNNFRYNCLSRI